MLDIILNFLDLQSVISLEIKEDLKIVQFLIKRHSYESNFQDFFTYNITSFIYLNILRNLFSLQCVFIISFYVPLLLFYGYTS